MASGEAFYAEAALGSGLRRSRDLGGRLFDSSRRVLFLVGCGLRRDGFLEGLPFEGRWHRGLQGPTLLRGDGASLIRCSGEQSQ
jgi:hypothetical protein